MKESLRELRTNIRFCGDDIKTILFTSVMPNEGKSTVVMDLARSMVQAGNCWITPGTRDSTYVQPIIDGVANGTIGIQRLRENVTYLIKTVVKFV